MTQSAVLAASGSAGTTQGFKNKLINGNMVVDQRNAGASVTPTTDSTYTLDRWSARLTQGSKYSVQQNAGSVTPPVGFSNYLGVTSLASTSVGSSDYYLLQQSIEGFNFADCGWGTANAKTITLSFWVYSSLTGTFGGSLLNSASSRSYPFTYTISAANTWEQKSITIAGDTSGTWIGATNGTGLRLYFNLGTGTTYSGTAGSWSGSTYLAPTGATSVVGTSGATLYITGVQLEVGTTATNFDFRSIGQELLLCQRYYETNNTNNGFWYTVRNDGISRGLLVFIVQKRAAPTVVLTAPAGSGSYTALASSLGTSTNTCDFGTSSNYSSFGVYTASAEL